MHSEPTVFRILGICKGPFSAVSTSFSTSNTSFCSIFCDLSDDTAEILEKVVAMPEIHDKVVAMAEIIIPKKAILMAEIL